MSPTKWRASLASAASRSGCCPDWDDNAGHAQVVLVDPEQGFYEAGVDPRGDGSAAGWRGSESFCTTQRR